MLFNVQRSNLHLLPPCKARVHRLVYPIIQRFSRTSWLAGDKSQTHKWMNWWWIDGWSRGSASGLGRSQACSIVLACMRSWLSVPWGSSSAKCEKVCEGLHDLANTIILQQSLQLDTMLANPTYPCHKVNFVHTSPAWWNWPGQRQLTMIKYPYQHLQYSKHCTI